MTKLKGIFKITYVIPLMWMMGCSTTSYRNNNDLLLKKYQIEWPQKQIIEDKGNLTYAIKSNLKPKQNGNFLLFPRIWFFYKTNQPNDTTKFDKWQREVIGEEPAIIRKNLMETNAINAKNFLQSKGYLDAIVTYKTDTLKGYKSEVTFILQPGLKYLIDTIIFSSPDDQILKEINKIAGNTLLAKNKAFEYGLYNLEKERIIKHLRNEGYVNFSQNAFDELEVDTVEVPFTTKLYQNISLPPNDSNHISYTVRQCFIHLNLDIDTANLQLDTIIDGIQLKTKQYEWQVKPNSLIKAIKFRPGIKYKEEDYLESLRLLSNLGVFKFIRIKPIINSGEEYVDIEIELSTAPKIEIGFDVELNYTNRSNAAGAGNLIGLAMSPSIRHRNLLKGAENSLFNFSAGVEFNPEPKSKFWNTIDLRVQNIISIPRFNNYLGLWGIVRYFSRNSSKDNFLKNFQQYATAKLSGTAGYVLLLDFYRYQLANIAYGVDLNLGQNKKLSVNHTAFDYIIPYFYVQGQRILETNPFLASSFSKQLFASILFRDINISNQKVLKTPGLSSQFNFNFETAGSELWLANLLIDKISGEEKPFRIFSTDFSQFLKSEVDFRLYYNLPNKSTLAARLNTGLAVPFGYTKTVPYIKQFYVGGPNSIRGWAARGLGPGGYIDSFSLTESNRLVFFQAGDLKMEFNLELRFKAFWRIQGALFIDGGNVWTLKKDSSRPGSNFQFNKSLLSEPFNPKGQSDAFYKQIALSSGLGMRIDFTYFMFRLDLGLPVRYPYRGIDGSYWAKKEELKWKNVNLNFGLGLPF
jgi:outer membrane protein insertion porin family